MNWSLETTIIPTSVWYLNKLIHNRPVKVLVQLNADVVALLLSRSVQVTKCLKVGLIVILCLIQIFS